MGTIASAAKTVAVEDDVLAAIDTCYERGWTDGLPVVPPEQSRVEAMLAMEGRPPETVIATHPTTGLECSILAAAVNAVMAGCLPEYFPVVVAALEAANEPGYNFHGSAASTGGSAPLLVVAGPVVADIGMNAAGNVFGPGNRANATIGRAMRLVLMNVFEMIPGISDQSTQGHPGKYCSCIAERAERKPVGTTQRGTRLRRGHLQRDRVRGRRLLQRREPRRQHAGGHPRLHRRHHGQSRLHHHGAVGGRPVARTRRDRRRHRLEQGRCPQVPVRTRLATRRGHAAGPQIRPPASTSGKARKRCIAASAPTTS